MQEEADFVYDSEKSRWLRHHRGLGFEEIVQYIEDGRVVNIRPHPNQEKYPDQWLYDIEVDDYIYVVPFLRRGRTRELKTLFPSRVATRKYKGQLYEKE